MTSNGTFNLLLLNTTTPILLSGLNGSLVGLGCTGGHESTTGLEGTSEITSSGLAEEVDLGEVGLKGALERDDGLDKEGVGVLEVQVHHTHHADTHQLAAKLLAQLTIVVIHVGSGNGLGALGATHRSRLDILQSGHVCGRVSLGHWGTRSVRHTLLSIDLVLSVQGHGQDDEVR